MIFNRKEYMKQYRQRPEARVRAKYRYQKPEYKEWIRQYGQRPEVKERHKQYMRKYNQKPEVKEYMKKYLKQYRNKPEFIEKRKKPEFIERARQYNREYYQKQKSVVLQMLGGKCVYCGCNNPVALEINHKNGGGYEEHKKLKGDNFYHKIFSGKRSKDDLELTCRVCNANHYLKQKGITGISVTWTSCLV